MEQDRIALVMEDREQLGAVEEEHDEKLNEKLDLPLIDPLCAECYDGNANALINFIHVQRCSSCEHHPSVFKAKVKQGQLGALQVEVRCTTGNCDRVIKYDTNQGVDPTIGVISALRNGQNFQG